MPRLGKVATTPPMPSSQTRVGVMKYALAGSVAVALIEIAIEMPTTIAIATRAVAWIPIPARVASHATARISTGQNR